MPVIFLGQTLVKENKYNTGSEHQDIYRVIQYKVIIFTSFCTAPPT
jgi:hypothetical protein